jgi:chromosome segregation ATPase
MENAHLYKRANAFLVKDVKHWTLFQTIEEILNVAERQQKELEGYIDDVEQLEGMLRQANERIKELEEQARDLMETTFTLNMNEERLMDQNKQFRLTIKELRGNARLIKFHEMAEENLRLAQEVERLKGVNIK